MKASKSPRLGRGLGELFQRTDGEAQRPARTGGHIVDHVTAQRESTRDAGEPVAGSPDDEPITSGRFAELDVEAISPNPRQPRTVFDQDALDELVESIREIGVLQPVVVRPLSDGRYELVMGERRLRASKAAGQATIPAIIRETEQADLLRDALLENLHRAQLNPLEEAAAYQQMLDDFSCTQDELAQRVKRSRPRISNAIRLLRLPPTVQRRVAAGVLSAGHARALLGVEDKAAQERLAQRIVAEGLSVRAVEELVMLGEDEAPKRTLRRKQQPERSDRLMELERQLADQLETRVSIEQTRKHGKITVEFADESDLERIVELIGTDSRQ